MSIVLTWEHSESSIQQLLIHRTTGDQMKCADWATPVEHETLNMTSYISTLSLNRADFHFTKLSLKKKRKMYCTFKLYFIAWLSLIYLLKKLSYGIFYNITLQKIWTENFLNNYEQSFCKQRWHSINNIPFIYTNFFIHKGILYVRYNLV